MKVYNDLCDLIGKTPILKLGKYSEDYKLKGVIYAKLDYMNIFGSAKDRVALQMINDALKKGKLTKDSTIIEPTSGNTGIGLAAIAKLKGLKMIICMPENMSPERIKLIKAYGAEIVLTSAELGMEGAIKEAKKLAKQIPNSFIPDQFKNKNNSVSHFKTTAREIYKDMDGKIDVFIAGIGTGGTITGVSKYLKMKNPDIKIIGVEPESSPFITKGIKGPHKIQGIGAGFIPKVLDLSLVDKVVTVSDDDALNKTLEMANNYSLLIGISGAATICAATTLLLTKEYKGKNVVVFLPDSGTKYMSLPIFD